MAKKHILPECRKEKAGLDYGPPSCLPPTQHLLWRAVVLLSSLLPYESLSKDSERSVNRKHESEKAAEWTGTAVLFRRAVLPPLLNRGAALAALSTPGFGCVLALCSLFTWLCGDKVACLFSFGLFFSAVWLDHWPLSEVTVLGRCPSSLIQEPLFLHSVV